MGRQEHEGAAAEAAEAGAETTETNGPRPPLTEGETYGLTVDNLAFGGEGVGRVEGVPVFVRDVCPGERVQVRVTEVHKRFARGVLVAIEEPSPDRREPACPDLESCGLCHLQHLAYEAQTAAKTAVVRDTLARLGRLPDVPVADTVPSPKPHAYRNKASLHAFTREDGSFGLGFHGRDPNDFVEAPTCSLFRPELDELIGGVGEWLRETGWPVYDSQTGEGLVREVALRCPESSGEATMLLVTGRRDIIDKGPQIARLRKAFPQIVGVRHLARTRASQSERGRNVGELIGRPLHAKVGGLSLRVSPESFFQVNDALIKPLLDHVREALDLRRSNHVLDLYGGIGTFGLPLARDVERVTVLEVDPTAVWDATKNADHNGLTNVQVLRGQAEQKLSGLLREEKVDRVLLDPPRQGCSEAVLRLLAERGPTRLVYVSCDPATLARDLARLAGFGWRCLGVQPFDMFPQTYHIEAVATVVKG